jgi:molybdopterin converting factor subunit 1
MMVIVRMFASARDAAGFDRQVFEIEEPRLQTLTSALHNQYPSARALLSRCRFAVNMEYVRGDAPLNEGDEVAVIPPVSGG